VRLYFIKRLRDEIKFANAGALVKQIQKDIVHAKKTLKNT
jgi:FAD synthase